MIIKGSQQVKERFASYATIFINQIVPLSFTISTFISDYFTLWPFNHKLLYQVLSPRQGNFDLGKNGSLIFVWYNIILCVVSFSLFVWYNLFLCVMSFSLAILHTISFNFYKGNIEGFHYFS